MLIAKHLQRDYNKLYKQLRTIVWPYAIIVEIADLEIAVYKTFPSIAEIRTCLARLKTDCLRLVRDNEDLKEAFEVLEKTLDDGPEVYAKLDVRHEGAA